MKTVIAQVLFLSVVGGSRLVSGGGLVSWLVDGGVGGLALVPDVHDVAGVAIGGVVGHDLGAAVGEEDTVLAVGGVAVTGLVLAKVHVALVTVLGLNSVVLILGGGGGLVDLVVGGRGSPLL